MASLVRVDSRHAAAHRTSRTTSAHRALRPGLARQAVCASMLFPVADFTEPLHYDIGNLKIVLIKHHHVRVTFDAVVRKQKKLCVAAGSPDVVDRGNTAISASITIGPQSTHGVVPPKRKHRLFDKTL